VRFVLVTVGVFSHSVFVSCKCKGWRFIPETGSNITTWENLQIFKILSVIECLQRYSQRNGGVFGFGIVALLLLTNTGSVNTFLSGHILLAELFMFRTIVGLFVVKLPEMCLAIRLNQFR